jgi:hypothetical protein
MATGADAIEAVAKSTGLLQSTVGRPARALREAGKDQWPQARPGGGKNSKPVQPHHLVNLALALSVDPFTDAPEVVAELRNLEPSTSGESSPFLPGATLGETLDLLVDKLSRPPVEGDEIAFDWLSITIDSLGNRRPIVQLRALGTDGDSNLTNAMCYYLPPPAEIAAAPKVSPGRA